MQLATMISVDSMPGVIHPSESHQSLPDSFLTEAVLAWAPEARLKRERYKGVVEPNPDDIKMAYAMPKHAKSK